jgi:hypothetical protein
MISLFRWHTLRPPPARLPSLYHHKGSGHEWCGNVGSFGVWRWELNEQSESR